MNFKYLVCAALQDELIEFLRLVQDSPKPIGLGADFVVLNFSGKKIEVATFASNKMGMPYNAAKLMEVILKINPRYILFIGTCAGLREYAIGSVLIPHRIYAYESGKYEKGDFSSDLSSYDTSDLLRREADNLKESIDSEVDFEIVTDEYFGSGAAVINDLQKVEEILKKAPRKMAGLDMEAYSIACINHILRGEKELLVIKGISDYANDKQQSESIGNKEVAKRNSAKIALELIRFLEKKGVGNERWGNQLDIETRTSNVGTNYPIKLLINIRNNTPNIITIYSESFIFEHPFMLQPNSGNFNKPLFRIGLIKAGAEFKDNYEQACTLKPNDVVNTWVALHPDTNMTSFEEARIEKKVGIWVYRTAVVGQHSMLSKNELLV